MPITFVFCVESGPLEGMTTRAVQTLRRWGGNLANSPVIAVTPRFGPALDHRTLQRFDALQVNYLNVRPTKEYRWYTFLNKPSAVLAADEAASTDLVAWMDGDVLFTGEPNEYLLTPDEDIAAYAPNGWIASSGPGDPNEAFWDSMCKAVGMDINELPFVETEEDHRLVRLYWNAGIFVYRKSSGYARVYRDYCVRLLAARVAHQKQKLFYHEQIAMALAGAKLRWKQLARSHNFTMEAWSKRAFASEQLREARVIHYHDFMREENRGQFVKILSAAHPEVARFVEEAGPIESMDGFRRQWLRKGLKLSRGIRQRAHLKRCRMF